MIDLSQNGLAHGQVLRALSFPGSARRVRYELWALRNGSVLKKLRLYEKRLRCRALDPVKYSGSFVVDEDAEVHWRTDLLQLVFVLETEGRELRYPFPRLRPVRVRGIGKLTVDALDETVLLRDSTLGERILIEKGTAYTRLIEQILSGAGFQSVQIEPGRAVFASAREDWEADTPVLHFINQLLDEIGYGPLSVNRGGVLRASPYLSPAQRAVKIRYDAGENSVILRARSRELCCSNHPNRFLGYVSNPDAAPMVCEYVNRSPSSPNSPENNGGYTITAARRFDNAADAESLRRCVMRWADETDLLYEELTLTTAVMPHHETEELVGVSCEGAGGTDADGIHSGGIYVETGWEISDVMTHTLRRLAVM